MTESKKSSIKYVVLMVIVLAIGVFVSVKVFAPSEEEVKNMKMSQMIAGQTDVEGEGIVITASDYKGEDKNHNNIVFDTDLVEIVNMLEYAGAEAISINGERVLSTNKIKVNKNKIKINNNEYDAPYVIKAIGNSEILSDTFSNNILNEINGWNNIKEHIEIEVDKKDKVVVPKIKENASFEYATYVE